MAWHCLQSVAAEVKVHKHLIVFSLPFFYNHALLFLFEGFIEMLFSLFLCSQLYSKSAFLFVSCQETEFGVYPKLARKFM